MNERVEINALFQITWDYFWMEVVRNPQAHATRCDVACATPYGGWRERPGLVRRDFCEYPTATARRLPLYRACH